MAERALRDGRAIAGRSDDNAHPAPSLPLLLIVSSLGAILAPLNSTMVAVALPDIRDEFSLSRSTVAWLISGYLIAMAVAQPIGGRLGDQLGRARVYRAGLLVFLVLSIATSLAPNFALLVTLRVAQAAAGAALIPNGVAMLRAHAPPGQLGRVNGINSAVLSFAAAVGPLVGAGVLAIASWRWLFPISAPFILLALVLLPRVEAKEERLSRTRFDPIGTVLFVLAFVAITFELAHLHGGIDLTVALVGALVTVTVIAAFVLRQRTTASPAAEWRLFRQRSFCGATAYILLTNLTMYTTLLMIPFFVRDVQGRSTELSGLLLGAMSVLVAVTAPFGGRLSDGWGRRPSSQAGGVLMLVATVLLLAGLRTDVHAAYLAGCLALLGLGLGIGSGPANTAAIESAPRSLAGSAAGTSSMMRYAGSIVGAGILAGVLSGGNTSSITTFRLLTAAIMVTAGLAVIASMFIHRFVDSEFIAVPEEVVAATAR